ncbi:hypothetical protein D3C71_1824920 [compost metagenome]
MDVLGVEPFAGLRQPDVGLVLVVRRQDLDLLAQDLATEILDGQPRRLDRTGAAEFAVQARLVVQNADPDDVGGLGCSGRQGRRGQKRGDKGRTHSCFLPFFVSS